MGPSAAEAENIRSRSGRSNSRGLLRALSLGKGQTRAARSGKESKARRVGRLASHWDYSLLQLLRDKDALLLGKRFVKAPASFPDSGLVAVPMPMEARATRAQMATSQETVERLHHLCLRQRLLGRELELQRYGAFVGELSPGAAKDIADRGIILLFEEQPELMQAF